MIAYINPVYTTFRYPAEGLEPIWNRVATPAGLLSDAQFLLQAIMFREPNGECTVVLSDPVDFARVGEIGWTQYAKTDSAWQCFVKEGCRINVLTGDEPTSLGGWFDLVGTHFYATPGYSAQRSMRANPTDVKRLWQLKEWEPKFRISDITWTTSDRADLRAPTHRWDMRSAYLNALGAAELPLTALRNTGPDPTTLRSGFYRVRVDPNLPQWFYPSIDRHGCAWIGPQSLVTITAASKPNGSPEIVDSWTPVGAADRTGHSRLFRSWADDWRDAILKARGFNSRFDVDPGILKAGYAEAIGLMDVKTSAIYRPDWRMMGPIDGVRASLIRRALAVKANLGLEPVRVWHDAMWYATNDRAAVGHWIGEGDRIGNMRWEGVDESWRDSDAMV